MSGSLARDDAKPSFLKDSETEKALKALYEYAESEAIQKIEWYHQKKQWKATMSRALRLMVIGLFSLGCLVPIVKAAFPAVASIQPERFDFGQAGYLLIALAAGFLALDRFFGYSTGWVRYVTTAMEIEKSLEAYRMEWTRVTAKNASQPYRTDVIDRLIRLSKDFVLSTLANVEQETKVWASEFRTNPAHIAREVRARIETIQAEIAATEPELPRQGAVSLTVTNGAETDEGFSVLLDDKLVEEAVLANKCEILSVTPGFHKLKVLANIGSEAAFASEIVSVQPGMVLRSQVTLETAKPASAAPKPKKGILKAQPPYTTVEKGNGSLATPVNSNGKGKTPEW